VSRVLVTGGAGFIGSALVRALLERGDLVAVLDNLSSGSAAAVPAGCELVQADVADAASVEAVASLTPEVVIHAAAQISVVQSQADPERDRLVNLVGTAHVLEGARRAGAHRFVFLSSGGAVYGETSGASEQDLPVPASYYAIHKLAAEHYVAMSGGESGAASRGESGAASRAASGMQYAIARLANVYGPGQRADLEGGVVAIFASALSSGAPVTIYGTGEQRRDFVHVADVVAAVLAMVDTPAAASGAGRTWNVGTGESTSINELLSVMESVAGVTVERRFAPARAGELQDSRLIISRIHDDLRWSPSVSLADGVRTVLGS
jgi:UDP-glucose 4-epimerase